MPMMIALALGAVETVSARSGEFSLEIPKGGGTMTAIIIVMVVLAVGVWGFVIFKNREGGAAGSGAGPLPGPGVTEEGGATPLDISPVAPDAPAIETDPVEPTMSAIETEPVAPPGETAEEKPANLEKAFAEMSGKSIPEMRREGDAAKPPAADEPADEQKEEG